MTKAAGRAAGRKSGVRPEFNQLETFLKVAETRSFAGAAKIMGVSQPAVSQTIRKLEELYGGDLFERHRGAPVALTLMGRAILPSAKLLLFTVDQQIARALAAAQSSIGSLTIGFYSGLAFGPLNAAVAAFCKTRPDVNVRFVEGSPNDLHRQLNERVIDILFATLLPELTTGLNVQERVWKEPLVAVFRDDHPLAERESVTWKDLASTAIMLRSNQGDLSAFRGIAARMGDHVFECGLHDVSRGALLELIRLGLGTTVCLSSAAVPRDGIVYRPILDTLAVAEIQAIWPKNDSNPIRHRLLTYVRRYAAKA